MFMNSIVCVDWVHKPQNYKSKECCDFLNNFPLKSLELGWVAFHSVAYFQLK